MVCAMPGIDGASLREWRRSRGWDEPRLAREVREAARRRGESCAVQHGLVKMIKAWERGDHRISERYELLLHGLGYGSPPEGPARRAVLAGGAGGAMLAFADTLLFGGPDDSGARVARAVRHPAGIDQESVDSLAGVLAAQRRTEDSIGARAVTAPVLAQLAAIEDLVKDARGPMRRPLIGVAQQWAQFSAYLKRDAGDRAGDAALLSRALEWATEAGDVTMIATALTQRAAFALESGELGTAIGLAQAARSDRRAASGQRAYAWATEARAHAMAGDAGAAERAIGQSLECAGDLTPPGSRKPWLYWMSPEYFQCASGIALVPLAGDPRHRRRAVAALEEGHGALPADYRASAWTAVNLAHLAAVHVRGGDLDAAADAAMRGAAIARATASARLAVMLECVRRRMEAAVPGHPLADELGRALEAVPLLRSCLRTPRQDAPAGPRLAGASAASAAGGGRLQAGGHSREAPACPPPPHSGNG